MNSRPRTVALLALELATGLGGAGWVWLHRAAPAPRYRTVPLARSDVQSLVSSTGAVEAVTTVQVGTQVSGIVAELDADFNDTVRKGDLLARIDATLPEADVAAAEARLASARAGERRSALDLTRIEALHAQDAATDQELESARATHAVDAAEARAAEVALGRARRNLGYTAITAPIDGMVVRRSVDVGQTVNAGFSAPTLFVLVGDLTRVRVIAAVDEADIGRLAPGQPVTVTVAAWPERTFAGTVGEVRLDSAIADNVVTYPVVVEVENPDGKLLPGMTASVEFETQAATDVLCVANAALRYRPEAPANGAPTTPRGDGKPGGGRRDGERKAGERKAGTLWVEAGSGLTPVAVTIGIRGATCTEVSGDGLTEGVPVVIGTEAAEAGSASPFGAPATTNGFRGGGF